MQSMVKVPLQPSALTRHSMDSRDSRTGKIVAHVVMRRQRKNVPAVSQKRHLSQSFISAIYLIVFIFISGFRQVSPIL